jgi:hypothetical protein
MDVLEKENRIGQEIREGRTLAQVTDLLRWEKEGVMEYILSLPRYVSRELAHFAVM